MKKLNKCSCCGREKINGFCAMCREKDKKRYLNAKEKGFCVRCRKKPTIKNKLTCEECCKKFAGQALERYHKNKEAGICTCCEKEPTSENGYYCIKCTEKQREYRYTSKYKTPWLELKELFDKQNGKCAYTGLPIELFVNAECDHIIPRAKNGEHSINNLCWALDKINKMKWDLDKEEFIRLCKLVAEYNK